MTTSTAIIILASVTWYGEKHDGNYMANNDKFDMTAYTCATYLYPLGTELVVKYGDKEVQVVVTDRCDELTDLDLSKASFAHIADLDTGRINAEVIFDVNLQTNSWREKNGDPVDLIDL